MQTPNLKNEARSTVAILKMVALLSAILLLNSCSTLYRIDSSDSLVIPRYMKDAYVLDYKTEFQRSETDCGAAIILSQLSYWNVVGVHDKEYEEFVATFPADTDGGYSVARVRDILQENFGMNVLVVATIEEVIHEEIRSGRPVVAPVKMSNIITPSLIRRVFPLASSVAEKSVLASNHYVTVIGFTDSHYVISDPIRGQYFLEKNEFSKAWKALGSTLIISFS